MKTSSRLEIERYNDTIRGEVLCLLFDRLSTEFSTIDVCAAELNVSPKKLQRLLRDEGTSFSEVLNNYRKQKAKEFLKETRIPVKTIASRLGYSSGRTFNIACQRWFDKSPRKFRQILTYETS